MTLWTAADLCAATGGTMDVPFAASGVSIDTRTLMPGDLFVALEGTTNGHAHVADALARGAAGVLVHQDSPGPALRVADTFAALHALGAAGRARFTGRMVSVTGSVGKTTTKDMLRQALAAFGRVHAAQASYNNHWGVPLTLARLPTDAAFCVTEIGMNHAGEIAPLAALARPDVAVVTTIASNHIGHLGSLEAIAAEKGALLAAAPVGVVPAGPFCAYLAGLVPGRVLVFGPGGDLEVVEGGLLLRTTPYPNPPPPGGELGSSPTTRTVLSLTLAAPGAHMISNAAAAVAACMALGLNPARAAQALNGYQAGAGRGAQRDLGGLTLLDESYNASAASVQAALAVLRTQPGRRVAVLGDMLELGAHAAAEHASLVPFVAESTDVLYGCGPAMQAVCDALPDRTAGWAPDSAGLVQLLALRQGDAVLVKGSLGSRMAVVVQAIQDRASLGWD